MYMCNKCDELKGLHSFFKKKKLKIRGWCMLCLVGDHIHLLIWYTTKDKRSRKIEEEDRVDS